MAKRLSKFARPLDWPKNVRFGKLKYSSWLRAKNQNTPISTPLQELNYVVISKESLTKLVQLVSEYRIQDGGMQCLLNQEESLPPRLSGQELTPQVPLAKLWEMLPTSQRLRTLNALSKIVIKHRLPPEDLEVDHDYK